MGKVRELFYAPELMLATIRRLLEALWRLSGLYKHFLPRDDMRKRGLCCQPVSVRPSVCHVGALYPHG